MAESLKKASDVIDPPQGRQLDFLDTRIELEEIFLAGKPHLCAIDTQDGTILTSSPIGREGVTIFQQNNVIKDGRISLEQKMGLVR